MNLEIEGGNLNFDSVDGVKISSFIATVVSWAFCVPLSIFVAYASSGSVGAGVLVVAVLVVFFLGTSHQVKVLKDGTWHALKATQWHRARKIEKEISQTLLGNR